MIDLMIPIVALGSVLVALVVARRFFVRSPWLFRRASGDHIVLVRERGGARELVLQRTMEVVQTRQLRADPMHSGTAYTDGFHLCKAFARNFRRVLFLGAGGAIGPRQFVALHENVLVDVIERDQVVIDAAQRFFGLAESPRLAVHNADAQTFLRSRQTAQYDIMVVDLCDAFGIPLDVTTPSFFQDAAGALATDGVLCMNLLGPPDPDGLVMRTFTTVREVFGADHSHLFMVPHETEEMPIAPGWRNWLVFATGGQSLVPIEEVIRSSAQLDTVVTPRVSAVARGHVADPSRLPDAESAVTISASR